MKNTLATLLATCAIAAGSDFTDWPSGANPLEVGKKVTARFLASPHPNFGSEKPPGHITYPEVCTWYGALTFAAAAGLDGQTKALVERFQPLFGPEARLFPHPDHVDNNVFGGLASEIFLQTGDKRCLELGKFYADQQWDPGPIKRHQLGPVSRGYLGQGLSWQTRFWIDDMYMITIVQSQASRATKESAYIDRAAKEMLAYLAKLQEPNGLFYHAPDVPFFWGRGNGWMAAGMTELLRALPEKHTDRPAILDGYRKMMTTLRETQGSDGMWRQLVDDPTSWPETSCTAMFTFAFITGVKNGWLAEADYAPRARQAWIALTGYLDENADIREVCVGTNKLDSRQYYLDRPRATGDMHGQAPVLWCASAFLR